MVDVAGYAQVNEYRGMQTAQISIQDIRPSCLSEGLCAPDPEPYRRLRRGELTPGEAGSLTPDRQQLGDLWRYLAQQQGVIRESPVCLCRKAVRRSGRALSLSQMMVCLDVFAEAGLLRLEQQRQYLLITLAQPQEKKHLENTKTMMELIRLKGSE